MKQAWEEKRDREIESQRRTDFWFKMLFGFGALLCALAPTWLYFLIKWAASPEGFWQNIVLLGIGLWFLGGIQVILLFLWIGFVLYLISEF